MRMLPLIGAAVVKIWKTEIGSDGSLRNRCCCPVLSSYVSVRSLSGREGRGERWRSIWACLVGERGCLHCGVSMSFPLGSTYLGMTGCRRAPWHVFYGIASWQGKKDSVHTVETQCAVMFVRCAVVLILPHHHFSYNTLRLSIPKPSAAVSLSTK